MLPLSLVLLAGMSPLLAQVPDPTRPPSAAASAAGADAPAGTAATATAADSGMRMTILRPSGIAGAIVNGRYVEVGDRLDGKRVVSITEDEILLYGEGQRETISLTPFAEKTVPVKKKNAQSAAMRRSAGKTEQ